MDNPRLAATVCRESLPYVDASAAVAWKLLPAELQDSFGSRILASDHACTADCHLHQCHNLPPLMKCDDDSGYTSRADNVKNDDEAYSYAPPPDTLSQKVEPPSQTPSSPIYPTSNLLRHEQPYLASRSEDLATVKDREERQACIEDPTPQTLASTNNTETTTTTTTTETEYSLLFSQFNKSASVPPSLAECKYWQLKWAVEKVLAQPEQAALLYRQMKNQESSRI